MCVDICVVYVNVCIGDMLSVERSETPPNHLGLDFVYIVCICTYVSE